MDCRGDELCATDRKSLIAFQEQKDCFSLLDNDWFGSTKRVNTSIT